MRTRAFSLIELLIVVSIIAILAAIAVPSFMESQTRAKVSRVKSDMRSCAVALEMYKVDDNLYPPPIAYQGPAPFTIVEPARDAFEGFLPGRLTSPIAYIVKLPVDVFDARKLDQHPPKQSFHYADQRSMTGLSVTASAGPSQSIKALAAQVGHTVASYDFAMFSHGPDLHQDGTVSNGVPCMYDPTNGTISVGDIYYFGPGGLME